MDYPYFPDAVSRLQAFLRDCGAPDDIHWVQFTEVAWVQGRLYLSPLPREQALAFAQAKYDRAIPRRLGVKLGALCRAGATVYCYVYRPSSQLEAEHHMMPDGLKLSVPNPLWEAEVVNDQERWHYLKGQDDLEYKRFLFG